MKIITEFDVRDCGVLLGVVFEAWAPSIIGISTWTKYDHTEYGEGTDAESALDDLLHKLSVRGFDVGGLEGCIKIVWMPNEDEGDGETTRYYLGLNFNSVER